MILILSTNCISVSGKLVVHYRSKTHKNKRPYVMLPTLNEIMSRKQQE